MSAMIRMVWKEYRALRGLWLALAIFGLVCDAVIFLVVSGPEEHLSGWLAFAGVLPAGFALGAGAMLFALEREEATYAFLRCLPVTSPRVFAGKVLTALMGTLLLGLLLVAVTLFEIRHPAIGSQIDRQMMGDAFDFVLIYALLVVQGVGWSVFFSLRAARTLLAALLGGLGAVTCVSLVHFATEGLGLAKLRGPWGTTWDAPQLHLLATLAVWSADIWLGCRWLRARKPKRQRRNETERALKRLVWQSWRGSRRLLLVIVALGVLVPIALWPLFIPLTILGFALLGACTFLSDQETRQFRFFAERGISPRRLWLSRQIFWGGAAMGLAAILSLAYLLFNHFALHLLSDNDQRMWRWIFDPLSIIIWAALAFAAGQACSMFFQSGVLAAASGLVLAGLLAGWMAVMRVLDIGLWWSAAPLVAALLAATWLRSPGWLLERHTWRAWLPALSVPAITIATLLVSVPAYRVWEIPEPVTSIDVAPPPKPSPEAALAASRLERLCESLQFPKNDLLDALRHPSDAQPSLDQMSWLEKHADDLNEAIIAIENLPSDAMIASGTPRGILRLDGLGAMLLRYGQTAERDGDLDAAWRCYESVFRLAAFVRRKNGPAGEAIGNRLVTAAAMQLTRWSAQKGQMVARLRTAIEVLQRSETDAPTLAEIATDDYLTYIELIDSVEARAETADPYAGLIAKWAPWEIKRSRRLCRYVLTLNLVDARAEEEALTGRGPGRSLNVPRELYFARASHLMRTTAFGYQAEVYGIAERRCSAICYRRAAQLILGIEAWRLDRGALPENLGDLQRAYFETPPVDPYTNRAFEWLPWGLSAAARSGNGEQIAAGTPLVYSMAGWNTIGEGTTLDRLRRRSADDPIEPTPAEPVEKLDGLLFPVSVPRSER